MTGMISLIKQVLSVFTSYLNVDSVTDTLTCTCIYNVHTDQINDNIFPFFYTRLQVGINVLIW